MPLIGGTWSSGASPCAASLLIAWESPRKSFPGMAPAGLLYARAQSPRLPAAHSAGSAMT